MLSFLYPFLNFLQPGEVWPVLIPYRPMLVASVVVGLLCMRQRVRPDPALLRAYFQHPAFYWLCAFVGIQVISVYYSGVLSMLDELAEWEVFLLYVVISLLTIRDAAALRRYIWGTMVGSAYVIYYGLHAVAVHSRALEHGMAGAYGMYVNHNDYSFIIVMVLPFAWLSIRGCRRRWQKLLLLTLVAACIAGILLSLSRGGILALALELAMILWFTQKGGRRAVTLAALAVLSAGAITYQFTTREVVSGPLYTEEDAKDSRYELWRAARAMIFAHPILGVGSGRFREFAEEYAEISHDNKGKVAHNTYFEVAADTGMLGLACFMLMLFGMIKSLRDARLADATGDGVAEARLAALISIVTIIFRALLDAKATDWSFYFLAVVAIATSGLRSRAPARAPAAQPSGPPLAPLGIERPMIYRHR